MQTYQRRRGAAEPRFPAAGRVPPYPHKPAGLRDLTQSNEVLIAGDLRVCVRCGHKAGRTGCKQIWIAEQFNVLWTILSAWLSEFCKPAEGRSSLFFIALFFIF
jgi:hypothetical protein